MLIGFRQTSMTDHMTTFTRKMIHSSGNCPNHMRASTIYQSHLGGALENHDTCMFSTYKVQYCRRVWYFPPVKDREDHFHLVAMDNNKV
mmetsp:Transcript_6787/g.12093  ORF Transcript_6787/g.12093 Transcript_6787/m.12093 type:complete len:89 (+) Transcript_6787:200-466(+)